MRKRFLQQGCRLIATLSVVLTTLGAVSLASAQTRETVDIASALLEAPVPSMEAFYGEELHYSISMMGGEAARGAITVGRPTQDEEFGRVVPVQGLVQSVGLLSAMVRFKYGGFTWMSPDSALPIWGDKLLEDSGRSRSYETDYTYQDYVAAITRVEGERERSWTRFIPEQVDDAFSWIFRLRAAPLNIGDRYTFYIFDGWLLRRLHVRVVDHVERHEDVTRRTSTMTAELALIADAMDDNPALPWAEKVQGLAPVFTSRRLDDIGSMWISLDERRLPVGMEVRTPVGFMRIAMSHHVAPTP